MTQSPAVQQSPSSPQQAVPQNGANPAPNGAAPSSDHQQARKGAPAGQEKQPGNAPTTTPTTSTATSTEPQPGETPQQQARRIIKLQREGKIEELDAESALSLLIEEHGEDVVVNAAQISRGAREKMRQAAQLQKELEEARNHIDDPVKAMRLLEKRWGGKDKVRAFVEEWYAQDVQERNMSPEEREHRTLKEELESMRAEKARAEKEKYEARVREESQKIQQQIGRTFKAALLEAGLDADPHQMYRMATLAQTYFDEGVPLSQIDPKTLAREVAKSYESGDVASYVRKLAQDPERLRKTIGEEAFRALIKHHAEQVKAKQAGKNLPGKPTGAPHQGSQSSTSSTSTRNGAKPVMDIDAYFESLKRGNR